MLCILILYLFSITSQFIIITYSDKLGVPGHDIHPDTSHATVQEMVNKLGLYLNEDLGRLGILCI